MRELREQHKLSFGCGLGASLFSTLSEATLSELKSCMDAAAGCMAMDACLTTTLTEIAACF